MSQSQLSVGDYCRQTTYNKFFTVFMTRPSRRIKGLVTCPDCSRRVSIHAQACPGCGYPIALAVKLAIKRRRAARRARVLMRMQTVGSFCFGSLFGTSLPLDQCAGSWQPGMDTVLML